MKIEISLNRKWVFQSGKHQPTSAGSQNEAKSPKIRGNCVNSLSVYIKFQRKKGLGSLHSLRPLLTNSYALISVCLYPHNPRMILETADSSQTKMIGQSRHVSENGKGIGS